MATSTTPGYVSNSGLASRISALIDKWNSYKNSLRDLLTKPSGTVDMEDGTGAVVTIPTIPALQKTVSDLVDSATGAVAGSQAAASSAAMSASDAAQSQTAASGFKDSAAASAQSIATTQAAVESSAADAASSSSSATQQATAAQASAASAMTQADAAAAAKLEAASSADSARSYSTAAQSSASEAQSWALTAQNTVTGLLVYRGSFDASPGTFPASPNKGDFWKIGTAGSISGMDLQVGDQIIYSGTGWDKIDNTESVTAVAGRVGDVTIGIPDLAGLQDALDGKAPLSSPRFTTQITVDGAAVMLRGWGGNANNGVILFGDTASYIFKNGAAWSFYNAELGGTTNLTTTGEIWTSGNFTPTSKADLSGATFTGNVGIGNAPAAPLDVQCAAGGGRLLFRSANGGANVTLDSVNATNSLFNDLNFGATSFYFGGGPAHFQGSVTSDGTVFAPIGDFSNYVISRTLMYVIGPFKRRNATETAWVDQPRMFVQGGDPGSGAADGDLWIW